MSEPTVICQDERRREAVRGKEGYNGLDYLEVSDDQLTLTVYFLGKAAEPIAKENVRILGGRRIIGIRVTGIEIERQDDPELDDCMHVTVDRPGDFSTYRLCLIELDEKGLPTDRPLRNFDPRYACLDFSFKAGCPSDLDCKREPVCPPEKREEPEINYLAKDYASFRQLILDRLALIMPDWKERHVPDLQITLVELLAYVGDHLSYYQDAVATEAYLDTARKRISVRRHARLVDYTLHEGRNARAWVTLWVAQDLTGEHALKPKDFYLITDPGIATSGNVHDDSELPKTLPLPYLVFEPLVEDRKTPIQLYQDHNEIQLYTWGDTRCCLPKGATSATLLDHGTLPTKEPKPPEHCECPEEHDKGCATINPDKPGEQTHAPAPDSGHKLQLSECDVVVFEEVKGPKTGNSADADPRHRHAVRLTKVAKTKDPLTLQLIMEIEWAEEDALPFPVCVSSVKEDDCTPISDVSVVRGNVLLVDHGERFRDDLKEQVPATTIWPECDDACSPREVLKIAGRYRPTLSRPEVTFSEPLQPCVQVSNTCRSKLTPASAMLKQDVRQALPQVTLYGKPADSTGSAVPMQEAWEPRHDLLGSRPEDRHFVVEIDNDRRAHLRFGDGESGRIPDAGMTFQAVYRNGNGPAGNIGAEAISHIVFRNNLPHGVEILPRNPFPAVGGKAPEPIAEAKLYAPHAFRKELQRAITAHDYAVIVMRDFGHKVQRAAVRLRWTGSWYEVLVAIDPLGKIEADAELLCEITGHLDRYRRIGHDVVVKPAQYVPLDITLTVCVLPHYLRGHVKAALLDVFSNRLLPDSRMGFFHPDNLTFGDGIYLSGLIAAAQAVVGVESVVVAKLERLFEGTNQEIENGILPLGPIEIARLDNDPSFPENGKITLDIRGGR
jgi:hypothetical protein